MKISKIILDVGSTAFIHDCLDNSLALTRKYQCDVEFEFNGRILLITPGDTTCSAVDKWRNYKDG
jgi:hypothetical protein